jgi:catechol 2,3-dioxygenase-like lactoylglutathione lyase family enzyme
VSQVDPPRGVPNGGLWVRDPDGNLVNIRDEKLAGPPADPVALINTPGHPARQGVRGCPDAGAASPRRLGHVLLFTPNLAAEIDFYTRTLGMKLSDRSGSVIAFLRCSTDHHNLALLASPGPGFHHGSFEVGSVDEIGMGAARMQEAGWEPGWGLGRHVIGSNFFFYMRDPWGSFVEYYYDLDYIPEGCAWESARLRSGRCAVPLGTAATFGLRAESRSGVTLSGTRGANVTGDDNQRQKRRATGQQQAERPPRPDGRGAGAQSAAGTGAPRRQRGAAGNGGAGSDRRRRCGRED